MLFHLGWEHGDELANSHPSPCHSSRHQAGQALILSFFLRFAVKPFVFWFKKVLVGHSLDSWHHICCGTLLQANRDLFVSHKQQIPKNVKLKE